MAQKLRCPKCGKVSQAESSAVAQVVGCPHCGQQLRVPAAAPAAGASGPGASAVPRPGRAPSAPSDDEFAEVRAASPRERRVEDDGRRADEVGRRARRRFEDDEPRRRPGPRGFAPAPGGSLMSVHFGLGFIWWKNLLIIVCIALSLLPLALTQMGRIGPVLGLLTLLIAGVAGLCGVAALVFGVIGGFGCNRLPHELEPMRRLALPLCIMEVVFVVLWLLNGLLLFFVLATRRPAFGRTSESVLLVIGAPALGLLIFITWLAIYVLLMLFLRALARHHGDEETASKSIWVMIAFLVAAVVGPVAFMGVSVVLRMVRADPVTALVAVGAVGVITIVVWVWILLKILQTITAVRRQLAREMTTDAA